MSMIILLVLVLLLISALPLYRYSRDWGYYPCGIIAVICAIVAVMVFT